VESPYVLLMPGAAVRHQRRKCWPHYVELAEALIQRGVSVVTAPEPDNTEACGKVARRNALQSGRQMARLLPAGGGAAGCGILRRERLGADASGGSHRRADLGADRGRGRRPLGAQRGAQGRHLSERTSGGRHQRRSSP